MLSNIRTLLSTRSPEEEYTELVPEEEEDRRRTPIFVDSLNSFADSDRVLRRVREGSVVFAKVGKFKDLNVQELRRTLAKMKTVASAMGGDIVSVGEEWIIVAPTNVRIAKKA